MGKAIEAQATAFAGAVRSIDESEAAVRAACAAYSAHLRNAEARDLPPDTTRDHRARVIIARCAQRHGVSVDDIMSRSRRADRVAARYEAIGLVHRVFPSYSTPQLGALFGGRDHTSILWALGRTAKSQELKRARAQ